MSFEGSRVWLVTGSSTGFGRSMVELALEKGERVVATLRTPSVLDDLKAKYPANQLLVAQLDVGRVESISHVFSAAKEAFGRIDVVFNNAGISVNGEVEGTPEDAARHLFDVNFWGAANVNKEAVRFFRDENPFGAGGRLLVNSSYGGICPIPRAGYYTAAKFALEGITQTLATELDPSWNIKITLVEFGFFRTPANSNGTNFPLHPAYTNPNGVAVKAREFLRIICEPTRGDVPTGDVAKGVKKVYEVSRLSKPPMRLVLGKDAVGGVRKQIQSVMEDLESYEAWSEDLLED